MNRKKTPPTGRQGFTFMELIVVVGVLTILILLALLVINPKASINKAYDARRKEDLENLSLAFENYYSDYSCYPTQEQINNCDSNELDPYIKEIPCDPSTSTPYELVAVPAVCPQNFIAYTKLKYTQPTGIELPEGIDSFNCYHAKSPNIVEDPCHDCSIYYDSFVPTGTPTPTASPTPTPTATPTPSPVPYYYCSSLNNCTELPIDKNCSPTFPWPETSCEGACSNPDNICTPY